MNEFDLLRQLGTQIAAGAEPGVDVGARVIERIRQRRTGIIDPRLSLISICACALSAFAILVTWAARPADDNLAFLSDAAVMNTGSEALLRVLEP